MAQKTTVARQHAWKAEGLEWVYQEPGRYTARVKARMWELLRLSRTSHGVKVTGWYLVDPVGRPVGFMGATMAPAVDSAAAAALELSSKTLKGRAA
ncbi:hypothetical protein [Streptomyces yaizuensis]|uniref:Uncharacterized protein n=1 Tax=Streptomyces yaizuensis TaxID=2989713 RepID=A0AA86IVC9_9ACTN|nr:hypothetical protein [Streptomyces sp. YSPA8]BDT39496.1 hypothetical protein SYYSPA8_36890 [Streptomyces sp. YSPA8]